LIRQITVSNNRQNQISASALRANDPDQVKLASRFKKNGIFYERQEGAFAELEEVDPNSIESDYPNTSQGYVEIESLARCLSACAGDFDYAHSPGKIFESEEPYHRCFGAKRLRSIVFLTFLQNLHEVVPLVLKKDLGLITDGSGPRPSRLTYFAMCLLVRYLAKNKDYEFVKEYGGAIVWPYEWRNAIAKLMGGHHSGIRGELKNKFQTLEDSRSQSLKGAFKQAESSLSLKGNIDPFDVFAHLDEN
jgi:AIPR protein